MRALRSKVSSTGLNTTDILDHVTRLHLLYKDKTAETAEVPKKMKHQCSQISLTSSSYSISQRAWHKPLQEFLHPEHLLLKLPFQAAAVSAAVPAL